MKHSHEGAEALDRPTFRAVDEIAAARPEPAAVMARLTLHGLWCAGSLEGLARPTVAVVGSRAPTESGRRLAERLAADLSNAGVCVLSGLALGVDGAGHTGALAGPTPTIGVLGGGHRHFFPPRNRDLAERMIAGGGAVVSPYPPDAVARPFQFLQRNAVVAALADAVLVVEAATRSGALSTASWAAVSRTECLNTLYMSERTVLSVRFSLADRPARRRRETSRVIPTHPSPRRTLPSHENYLRRLVLRSNLPMNPVRTLGPVLGTTIC